MSWKVWKLNDETIIFRLSNLVSAADALCDCDSRRNVVQWLETQWRAQPAEQQKGDRQQPTHANVRASLRKSTDSFFQLESAREEGRQVRQSTSCWYLRQKGYFIVLLVSLNLCKRTRTRWRTGAVFTDGHFLLWTKMLRSLFFLAGIAFTTKRLDS